MTETKVHRNEVCPMCKHPNTVIEQSQKGKDEKDEIAMVFTKIENIELIIDFCKRCGLCFLREIRTEY